jgi:uncharacterized protein HemX
VSDNDSRDDGKVGAFLLGFFLAVIVCLGAGGVLFVIRAERFTALEMEARDRAEQAAQEAQVQRDLAEKAAREAKEAAEKPNN